MHSANERAAEIISEGDENTVIISYKGRQVEIPIGQLVNHLTQMNKVSKEPESQLDQESIGGPGDFPVGEKPSNTCLFSAATYAHWQAGELIGQYVGTYVNVQHSPHGDSLILTKGRVGQQISVISQHRHETCELWYKVWLPETEEQGWVHGDYVTILH